jgi:hypothetical protein
VIHRDFDHGAKASSNPLSKRLPNIEYRVVCVKAVKGEAKLRCLNLTCVPESINIERTHVHGFICENQLVSEAKAQDTFKWVVDTRLPVESKVLEVRHTGVGLHIEAGFVLVCFPFKVSRPVKTFSFLGFYRRGICVIMFFPITNCARGIRNDKPV